MEFVPPLIGSQMFPPEKRRIAWSLFLEKEISNFWKEAASAANGAKRVRVSKTLV